MMRNSTSWYVAIICGFQLAVSAEVRHAPLRRAKVGEKMASFRLAELGGKEVTYHPGRGRVSVVIFLAAHQKRSERAMKDLKEIVSDLQLSGHPLDFMVVISSGESSEYFQKLRKALKLDAPMLVDQDDRLWGRLGIIATPTVIVTDKDGRISWVRAGHGYDFSWEARAELAQVLGLSKSKKPEQRRQVKVLVNDTTEDRARRHVRMGRLLAERGRIGSAMSELRKAEALTPDSIDVQLEIGRLLCRCGQAKEALSVVGKIKPTKQAEEAEVKMLSGWAYRELGDAARAEKLLTESVRINPKSVRALYELGKIYHERKETEKAMEAYRRALAVQFEEASFSQILKRAGPQPKGDRRPGH